MMNSSSPLLLWRIDCWWALWLTDWLCVSVCVEVCVCVLDHMSLIQQLSNEKEGDGAARAHSWHMTTSHTNQKHGNAIMQLHYFSITNTHTHTRLACTVSRCSVLRVWAQPAARSAQKDIKNPSALLYIMQMCCNMTARAHLSVCVFQACVCLYMCVCSSGADVSWMHTTNGPSTWPRVITRELVEIQYCTL